MAESKNSLDDRKEELQCPVHQEQFSENNGKTVKNQSCIKGSM